MVIVEIARKKKRLSERLKRSTPRDGKPIAGRLKRASVALQRDLAEMFERREFHELEQVVGSVSYINNGRFSKIQADVFDP